MRWLVTGGAGFIGSHFMDHIREHESDSLIVCYDLLTYASNIDWAGAADDLIVADICDRDAARTAFERYQPDLVVNFAAESHVDNSYRQSPAFTRTNVDGVVSLLETVRDTTPSALFVQISTDEVYGDQAYPHSESCPLRPQNPYAATKAAAEFMVNSFARSFGLRTMITRSSNNWGPRQHPEKFIPAALEAKRTGVPMVVHGYDYQRDWIHVQDNARAIYELVPQGEGVWNIATGWQHSLSQVLDRVGDVPHKVSPERPGVDYGYYVDAALTWDVLGWRPDDFLTDGRWDSYLESAAEPPQTVRSLR